MNCTCWCIQPSDSGSGPSSYNCSNDRERRYIHLMDKGNFALAAKDTQAVCGNPYLVSATHAAMHWFCVTDGHIKSPGVLAPSGQKMIQILEGKVACPECFSRISETNFETLY